LIKAPASITLALNYTAGIGDAYKYTQIFIISQPADLKIDK